MEKCGLEIPLLLGVKFAHEFLKVQKICAREIGNKKFLAQELFVLPRKEREAFIRMAKHSFFASGNIRPDDYEIIKKMSQEDIKKGLNLHVNFMDKDVDYMGNVGYTSFIVGSLVQVCLGPFFGFVPSLLCCSFGGAGLMTVSAVTTLMEFRCCVGPCEHKIKEIKL